MAAGGGRVATDPRPTLVELATSWESCGPAETDVFECDLAGLTLRIEGRGPLLARLRPALEHHPAPTRPPDLTIRVWDLETASIRPLIDPGFFQSRGDLDVGHGNEVRVRYDWPLRAIQAWDAAAGIAYWVAEDPATLTWWEEAAPFRPVLAWWLTSHRRYFAHGAALAIDGKAVLLVGPGGSGKSTTALRAQRAGLGFLGDDYCLVAEAADGALAGHDSGHVVVSLYRTMKLRPVDGPTTETELAANADGRKVVLLLDHDDGGLLAGAQLVGVAAVSVGGSETTEIDWGERGTVLRALAPTTFEQLPGVGPRSLTAFASMLRSLPTAVVRLGPDADEVVATVRRLIGAWS